MKIFKRILITLFCIAVAICGVGCKVEPLPTAEDFSLKISVDKTTLSVGETITITATFKNLSGRDVYIEFDDYTCYKLDGNYNNVALSDTFNFWFVSDGTNVVYPDVGVKNRHRTTISKGIEVMLSKQLTANESGDVVAFIDMSFYVNNIPNASEKYTQKISLSTEKIKVLVKKV